MSAPAAVTGGPAPLAQLAPTPTQPATQPAQPAPQQQEQEPAGNIYAAPEPQRRSDIEELLSLSVPSYSEPQSSSKGGDVIQVVNYAVVTCWLIDIMCLYFVLV